MHYDAFERACGLIDGQLKEILDGDTSSYDETDGELDGTARSRKYGTISVFGDRGVGKTSFLLSIRDKYHNNEDVAIMPFIDPTLIEEKGHVFLLIVGIIDEMVKNALAGMDDENGKGRLGREWASVKKDLAKGLPSLDNGGLT